MKVFDLTGTNYLNLRKNPQLKNHQWIINDKNYILTNEDGTDIFTPTINKIKEIQTDLINHFDLTTLSKYEESLKNDFIRDYLNINISKRTFNDSEIKTTFNDYKDVQIVHDDKIPDDVDVVVVDMKSLSTYERLKMFQTMKEHKLNWIIVKPIPDLQDYLKYFEIVGIITFKGRVVYIKMC